MPAIQTARPVRLAHRTRVSPARRIGSRSSRNRTASKMWVMIPVPMATTRQATSVSTAMVCVPPAQVGLSTNANRVLPVSTTWSTQALLSLNALLTVMTATTQMTTSSVLSAMPAVRPAAARGPLTALPAIMDSTSKRTPANVLLSVQMATTSPRARAIRATLPVRHASDPASITVLAVGEATSTPPPPTSASTPVDRTSSVRMGSASLATPSVSPVTKSAITTAPAALPTSSLSLPVVNASTPAQVDSSPPAPTASVSPAHSECLPSCATCTTYDYCETCIFPFFL